MSLRIAIVGHHVAPIRPPFAGGVESLTYYLCRWLARRGHDVVLHALPGSAVEGVTVRELAVSCPLSAAAQRDVSMPPRAFMDVHHAYQSAMIELAAGNADLVHIHSLHYLPVAMAELLTAPALLTLHTPPTPWFESALLAHRGRGLRTTAVSTVTAARWSHAVGAATVVPNGVDVTAWPAGPGGPDAIWCGRVVPEKAPHLAIAAARAAGLRLRLAGPLSDPGYWGARVEPLLGDDVTYLGHLDHRELAVELGASAVALMTPDWDEPFGLAAVEAMATGTPVAGFRRGGLASVVGDGGGVLVDAGDVQALAAAALTAAAFPRDAVRAHAARHHGIDAMGRAYEAIYAELLSGGRSLRAA